MVFLGYILPKEQQAIYNKDTALALKNYKNDIASMAFTKPAAAVQSQPLVLAPSKVENIVNDALNDIISSALKPAGKIETTSKAPTSPLVKASKTASRPTSPLVKELEAKLASPKLGLRSKNLTVDTTVPDIEVEGKPSPTETATTSITDDDTFDSLLNRYTVWGQDDFTKSEVLANQAKEILKKAIEKGEKIYGVNSGNQGKKNIKDHILEVYDDNLTFKDGRGRLKNQWIGQTLKYNYEIRNALAGQGMKKVTGVRKYNSEKNFGIYNLSLKALRKGNLTIYRPSSNHVLINKKNISPRLIKMINEIRSKMKFELEDYDNLKKSEQMVIDQIINLLRMTYPDGMRRALDETVWNLKQRYEILISEINAGNDGKLVKDELKDVLAKLKELKTITTRKYNFIMSAIE